MAQPNKIQTTEHHALSRLISQHAASAATQKARSRSVYDHVLRNANQINGANFQTVATEDLGLLFHATDEVFFDGLVGKLCERVAARPLSFRLSTRMTSTGGMTTMQRPSRSPNAPYEFEIAVATTPLFESFRTTSTAKVGGVECHDRLEALQRIMEHEMVHLVEMLLTHDSNCSAAPFKRIVNRFFGHTESKHRLLTPSDTAKTQLGISPGDRVRFRSNGKTHLGVLHRVTKRATVLVPDTAGVPYDDGCRYAKYYVPLQMLRRA